VLSSADNCLGRASAFYAVQQVPMCRRSARPKTTPHRPGWGVGQPGAGNPRPKTSVERRPGNGQCQMGFGICVSSPVTFDSPFYRTQSRRLALEQVASLDRRSEAHRFAASVEHHWMALPILRPLLPQLLPSEPCRSGDDQHNAAPAVKPKGGQGSALFVEHRRALLR
jgi:hypothetical protein